MHVEGHMILTSTGSRENFPHNRADDFTTLLERPVETRHDNIEYEIALAELQFVTTVPELSSPALTYQKPKRGTVTPQAIPISLSRKKLTSTADLVKALQLAIETAAPTTRRAGHPVKFSFDPRTFKTTVTLLQGHSITLSTEMGKMLGFENVSITATTTSKNRTDLYAEQRTLYVFCDQIESITFGNSKARVLGFITIPKGEPGVSGVITKSFQNPMFVKIAGDRMDRIRVYIKDEQGGSTQSGLGSTVVRLTLRERVSA